LRAALPPCWVGAAKPANTRADAGFIVSTLIVDTRNWWPGEHVLLSPFAVKEISWSKHQVLLDVNRDRLKSSPPWSPLDTVEEAYERRLHDHYGWPGYGW
jgi:hypothetical protein